MTKISSFFIVLILLAGCKNELVKKPKRQIEREKMVDIMYDLSLLEAMKIENPTLMDSIKYTSNQYIYKKHKIDSVQFAQSNSYYAADYVAYEKMYNQIKTRLDKEKTKVNSFIKAEATKKMLEAKAKKKRKAQKEADSIKKKQLKVSKPSATLNKAK